MKTNLFGTDGIRKRIGESPLTAHEVPKLGHAIASWLSKKYGKNAHVAIAHDTRNSGDFIKTALKTGFLMHPLTIHDALVLTTPAMCQLIRHTESIHCGIIISASHNQYQDNGIKVIDAQGNKITVNEQEEISKFFYDSQQYSSLPHTDFGTDLIWHNATQQYIQKIASWFPLQFLAGHKIVLDCANGAASTIAPEIFRLLGANLLTLHHTPNGKNINHQCGSIYPQSLQTAVVEKSATIGFAFDGDGDRVIAVNRDGEIKDGDDLLALLFTHPQYKNQPGIVGTIMSNHGLASHLKNNNKQLFRTAVGDTHITKRLLQEKMLLGGEPSGHIIMRDYMDAADGIFTALRVFETITHTNNWKLTTFDHYPQITLNVPFAIKKDLQSKPLSTIISSYEKNLIRGRLIVRYSGTEQVLRIMVEDQEAKNVEQIGTQLATQLKKELHV